MSYRVGVDLGTTYSSAAVAREGRAQIVPLGNRAAVIPSVVLARDDGSLLTGEAAEARAATEPGHVAREFKRRLGDPTPIPLGAVALTADALMAALLPPILDAVAAREGGPADAVAITHPANWGPARRDMLLAAIESHPLPPVTMLTEPEAAAIHYAATEHIEPDEIVAVYDLGGGTFDAALLRRRAAGTDGTAGSRGFEVIGRPEGIDRLGGVDFDAAVLAHVNRFLGGALDTLDLGDPAVAAGMSRLRADCVEAKEVLSTDTDVEIPVLLPGLRTEVRMTRGELEAMIRPALGDTIGALRRAMTSAAVLPEQIAAVLLVGGSSRIPLVARLVGAELGRPVAVDVHPKHAVALGAALAAAVPSADAAPDDVVPLVAQGATAGAAAIATPAAVGSEQPEPATEDEPASGAGGGLPPGAVPAPVAAAACPAGPEPPARPEPAAGPEPAGAGRRRRTTRIALVAGIVILLVGLIAGGVLLAGGGGDDEPGVDAAGSTSTSAPAGEASSATTATTTTPPTTTPPTTTPPTTTPPTTTPPTAAAPTAAPATTTTAARCETTATPFVCITSVSVDAQQNLVIPFEARGFVPLIGPAPNRHIHFYFPVGAMAENPANAGTGGPSPGDWVLWDQPNPFGPGGQIAPYTVADARRVAARSICVLVADAAHAVTTGTGNCLDLPPAVTGTGG